ncbi:Lysophospholipase, alpha-beta hydrolase superfamily [Geodermatophilus africanus]|uniref:Lysophospholipase, alpha-beta hydrolase superfamily n=1 Tax=Geodermatophilus africanus TaxID=1137993 RepID=A0A1H3CFE0_9ACTN|nr:epoxide hydrolase family protein [Geodermatophilus africanus]SDX52304.1 Lysophospholipase, alpha-beta hydrolase superfamily [Geodermatophilus africanus]
MTTVEDQTGSAIRPFRVECPEEALDDLRRRLAATRWPSRELVHDRSQGVQLATMQALARYWASEYEGRRVEARLNALPQFTTEIDGVDVHFIHVRSPHEDALPLIMTHGWPGSVVELLETVGPLTDPTAYGGTAEDAFDLVLPSIPGYGFSGEPAELGWNAGRTARAWAELMNRLGYTRYVAQGGDVGAAVTDAMARQAAAGLVGIHTNLLVTVLGAPQTGNTEEERAALEALATFRATGFGYFLEMATRPQTIGYALLDSPVALAAWLLDHDTDSYYKITRAFVDGQPAGNLTRDHILDNLTTYWLGATGATAARSYWEDGRAQAMAAGQAPPPVRIPVGYTTFPGEIFRAPRSWVAASYPTLSYFNEAERGGHFAAWEEPELFATELRAAFRSLRRPQIPTPRTAPSASGEPDTIVLVHGFWVTPRSWEGWKARYEQRGYQVLTPAYPGFEVEVEALNADPTPIAELTLPQVIASLEELLRTLDRPPILMGHSAGGTLVQLLLDRGHGAVGVVLNSAPTEGVRVLPLSQLRSTFVAFKNPANRHRAVGLTYEQWRYAFTNTFPEEDSRRLYERYAIPASGRILWSSVLANFMPGPQDAAVDYANDDRAPLLFVSGGEDHLMPPSVQRSNVEHYRSPHTLTEHEEYPGFAHLLPAQDGWEAIADHVLDWAVAHARRTRPEVAGAR